MQKQMSYKKIIICVCAAIAVIAAAVIVFVLNREETFRSILVYEVEGSALIEREGVGSMNAAQNLYLESGDRVSVAQDSSMRMKLDDDKYVMAEADTIFSVEAEGSDENSRTKICLEQGAITSEIQHPLSEGSQYETSTPNSVMAVRGTIYRVELYIDDNGDKNTKLCCFQGKVGTTPILPDGTYGEEVLVPAGSELVVLSDGTVDGPKDITYQELPEQALHNLRSMLENGQVMEGITLESFYEMSDQTEDMSEEAGQSRAEQTALSDTKENAEEGEADTDTAETVLAQAGKSGKRSAQAGQNVKASAADLAKNQAADQPGQNQQALDEVNTQFKAQEPVSVGDTGNDYTEENSQNDDYEDASENKDRQDKDKKDKHKSDSDKSDSDKSDNDKPVIPPQTVMYTVTFEYEGNVFATQEVKRGESVVAPLLIPEENGEWDFDFETRIKADTTIQWKTIPDPGRTLE